jgi:hypothetical protein
VVASLARFGSTSTNIVYSTVVRDRAVTRDLIHGTSQELA